MPEYLSPGVYVEEIETGPQPIEGVSTSTSGMVGAAEMGPITGLPRLVTSFPDFVRLYGTYLPEDLWGDSRFLAYAAQGFFQNGGQRLYIARVAGDNSLPASRELSDGFNDGVNEFLLTRPSEDMPESRDEITLVSSRGIENGTQITFLQRVGGGEQTETVAADTVAGNRVTLAAPTAFVYTRSAVVLIAGPAGFAAAPSLRLQTTNPGSWGSRVRVQSTPSSRTSTRLLGINLASLLRVNPIAVALGANPAGTDTITLGAAQADNLRVGDTLRFTDGANVETRTIIAIVSATDVQLDNTLGAPFTTASAVELVTPVSVRVNAPTANVSVNINVTPGFLINDRVVIESAGGDLAGTVTAVAGTNDDLTVTLDDPLEADNTLLAGTPIRLLNAGRGGNTVRVSGARNLYIGGAVELQNAASERIYAVVQAINGDEAQLSANVPATFLENDLVTTCEFTLRVQLVQTDAVTLQETILRDETHPLLSLAVGAQNNAITRLAEDSQLVTAQDLASGNAAPFNFPTTVDRAAFSSTLFLQSGADGNAPQPRHYRGTDGGPGLRTGIAALEDIDEISILSVPGISDVSVQGTLIEQCERLKDRFAVIDGPRGSDLQGIRVHRGNYDTKYAALYHPWLLIRDPLDDVDRVAPPSGHMIGIYARTDNERGVHKAPANEVIRGIVGYEQYLNKREQDLLNPSPDNINVLRDFRSQGRGLRVWGARCITSDQSFKYINVRRLFIFVEESLEQGTQWVVFEPNDQKLWDRVKQSITDFLIRVWRDGALMGVKEEEAFFVNVDRTTMTQDDIDNGRLIILIGIAPVKPAEFVIIRIGQFTGGSEVTEL